MKTTGVAAFALRHRKAIMVAVFGMCLWGVWAIFSLPSGVYPDVAFPRIVVLADRGEESVGNVMVGITRPLEQAVSAVPGLRRIRSKTIRGAVEMSLDFAPGTEMKDALAETRARVSALLPSLPPNVNTTIEQQTPSVFPVISFNVALDETKAKGLVRDGADLLQWVQTELRPRLARLPDVFLVGAQGAKERLAIVEADPRRLIEAGLSLDDVVKAVQGANEVEAVGRLERDYKQFQVMASNELRSLDDIRAIPVAARHGKSILLRDVADVTAGLADPTTVVTGNGQDAVVVSVFMRFGGKVTGLSQRVKATIQDITPNLPPGVGITPVYDQADLVQESLAGVRDAILIGMLLSVAVLWAFLSSWRLTFITALSIPVSVLGALAFIWVFHQSLNLMSLGGIAVAIGLIIDNAIVVSENIARRLAGSQGDRRGAIVQATTQIVGAVVGPSFTTVVVLVPLVLLEGVVGQFFKAMAVTLATGILVSLPISLTLTPIMSAGWLGPREGERTSRRWTERLAGFYEIQIGRLLRRPKTSAAALALIAAVGLLFSIRQETGFLPQMDEGGFVLDYFMPVGTSLSETDKNCRKIESVLLDTPEIASFSRRTGAELGFFATEQFTGDFLVGLKPRKQRQRHSDEVVSELRGRITREIPQIEVSFVQVMQDTINDLAGNPDPLEVKIFGSDYRVLQNTAEKIAPLMQKIPGVVDLTSGVSFGSPEMTYHLDSTAISRLGLTSEDVGRQLRTALLGEEASLMRRSEFLVPILVRYPDWIRRNPDWLSRLPVAAESGKTIPASMVGHLEEATNVNELARENQQPLVSVSANISGRDLGSIARDVQAMLDKYVSPRGVRMELAGQVESQARAFRSLLLILTLGILLVFLLLVIQFRSYRLPLVIFLTLPFSQISALLALRLTGTELNISAFMGLIMLVGLVVKNGIILIQYTAQLRQEGVPTLSEALLQAGRVRLRPVLMTSLTAIIALLPLALNIGAGAELQRPLAIAVIGGLSVATFFTLLVIPVAHVLLGEPTHGD